MTGRIEWACREREDWKLGRRHRSSGKGRGWKGSGTGRETKGHHLKEFSCGSQNSMITESSRRRKRTIGEDRQQQRR